MGVINLSLTILLFYYKLEKKKNLAVKSFMSQVINGENLYIKAIHTVARYYDAPISYEAIIANLSGYKGDRIHFW